MRVVLEKGGGGDCEGICCLCIFFLVVGNGSCVLLCGINVMTCNIWKCPNGFGSENMMPPMIPLLY
jgi:hypothetical protein